MANARYLSSTALTPPGMDGAYGDLQLDPATGALKVAVVSGGGGGGASGPQPSATSQSVTPATDGAPFLVAGNDGTANRALRTDSAGRLAVMLVDGNGVGLTAGITGNDGVTGGSTLLVSSFNRVFNGTNYDRQRGDATGTWSHNPPSTVSTALSGTITASGGTVAITMTNTTRTEVINPSTGTLWASWGTPAVNGAGSFPILANSSYNPPDRVAGTLTLLSTSASQPYTINRFS